jgi:CrcB protein
MTVSGLIAVAVAGAAGTLLRVLAGGAVARLAGGVPWWGTLFVNTAGCLAAGVVVGLADRGGLVPAPLRIPLVAGFLGGFTTFSAFAVDALRLATQGHWVMAAAYVAGTNVAGLAGVWLAWRLTLER